MFLKLLFCDTSIEWHRFFDVIRDVVVVEEMTFNMSMLMAVLVPIGVLIIAVIIVFFVFRHLQKQRPESRENLRVREELLPQEYGGIRVTQVGDSTLQVREITQSSG